ncbi:unnamed protein product [Hymenolepis diminuta]|uniref:DDE_Tnp_1_7 domain-containing protein n=1 Tax=Hymenolepis diminuta TaxID=6216 RepID=A0A0R3SFI1_HYMDI|nr:unnamed protein product [Hymenolepis diminuta]
MDSIETEKITAIFRSTTEQMNLSKPNKDSEDYAKNVGEFHYEPSVGELFMTCLSSTTLAEGFDIWGDDGKVQEGVWRQHFSSQICLNLAMRKGGDIHKCTAIVNRICNAFSCGSLRKDQFRSQVIDKVVVPSRTARTRTKLHLQVDPSSKTYG